MKYLTNETCLLRFVLSALYVSELGPDSFLLLILQPAVYPPGP